MITVSIDDSEIKNALDGLMTNLHNIDPALRDIGDQLLLSTKQRFANGVAPDGTSWEKNSNTTLARKNNNTPLIGESKRLGNEISYSVTNGQLRIGSPMVYSAAQQFGMKKGYAGTGKYRNKKGSFPIPWGDIPARPFLGLSDEDKKNVLDIIQEHLGL